MNKLSNIASFVYHEVVNRAVNAIDVIPCAIETVVGVGLTLVGAATTPLAAITLNKNNRLNSLANKTQNFKPLLSNIFFTAMRILNPNCILLTTEKGLCSKYITDTINANYEGLNDSKSLFKKHVATRASHAFAIPAKVVAAIADAGLAIPAVTRSIVTFGAYQEWNSSAVNQLDSVGDVIPIVSYHFRMMINPLQSSSPFQNSSPLQTRSPFPKSSPFETRSPLQARSPFPNSSPFPSGFPF